MLLMRGTQALIHAEHLKGNIRIIRSLTGEKVRLCMAVKANAYGHGSVGIARTALKAGVDALAVATAEEGAELRASGIEAPIILFGLPLPEEIGEIIENDIQPFVADAGLARAFDSEARKRGKVLPVHLKVDIGMGRLGVGPEELLPLAREVSALSSLRIGGVCTHFPAADSGERSVTENQVSSFRAAVEGLKTAGLDTGIVHAANSGAVLAYPESYFDMVRPGIILYGYYPSRKQERRFPFKPVMELETRIIFLKRVGADTPISYGMTYRTKGETVIATIGIGYGDGYPRLLSGRAEVLIKGKRYPVVGRICMDQCMVDVGKNPEVRLYDRVTLFGPDPLGPDAEELSDTIGMIPYEITTGIQHRVPRVPHDTI